MLSVKRVCRLYTSLLLLCVYICIYVYIYVYIYQSHTFSPRRNWLLKHAPHRARKSAGRYTERPSDRTTERPWLDYAGIITYFAVVLQPEWRPPLRARSSSSTSSLSPSRAVGTVPMPSPLSLFSSESLFFLSLLRVLPRYHRISSPSVSLLVPLRRTSTLGRCGPIAKPFSSLLSFRAFRRRPVVLLGPLLTRAWPRHLLFTIVQIPRSHY